MIVSKKGEQALDHHNFFLAAYQHPDSPIPLFFFRDGLPSRIPPRRLSLPSSKYETPRWHDGTGIFGGDGLHRLGDQLEWQAFGRDTS